MKSTIGARELRRLREWLEGAPPSLDAITARLQVLARVERERAAAAQVWRSMEPCVHAVYPCKKCRTWPRGRRPEHMRRAPARVAWRAAA